MVIAKQKDIMYNSHPFKILEKNRRRDTLKLRCKHRFYPFSRRNVSILQVILTHFLRYHRQIYIKNILSIFNVYKMLQIVPLLFENVTFGIEIIRNKKQSF